MNFETYFCRFASHLAFLDPWWSSQKALHSVHVFQLHSVPALCLALHFAAFLEAQSDPFPVGTPEVPTVTAGVNGFEADVGAGVLLVVVVAVVVVAYVGLT